MCLPLMAGAAEWFPLPLGKDVDLYSYDRSKLVISGDEITYWKKVVFQNVQKFKGSRAKSAIYRERIHCKEHTQRTLNYTLYGENGAVLETVATPDAAAEAIQPETVGDQFEKSMCQILAAKRKSADSTAEPAKTEPPKPEPPKVDPKRQAQLEELERLRGERDRIETQIKKIEQEMSGGPSAPPADIKLPSPGEV
jgi:hypothetical protein